MKLTYYPKSRRIYVPKQRRFINYDAVYAYIRSGNAIQATCVKSKVDVTNRVLRRCLELKANLYDDQLYALLRK